MFEKMKLRSFIFYLIIFFIIFGITIGIISPESDLTIDILASIILFVLFPLFWFKKQMKKYDMHVKEVITWEGMTKKLPSLFLITLTVLLFSLAFFWVQTYLFSFIAPNFAENQLLITVEMVKEYEQASSVQMFCIFISACIIAPVAEEFIFRGYFLKRIAQKTNIIFSLIITNLIFAILHMDYIGAFMFGFLLSLIYLKTNNLLYPIMIHFLNNTLVSLLDLFKIPIPDFINYTEIEQVASFMLPNIIIGLISLPFLIYYLHKYRLNSQLKTE
ncbi:CPBP family intramembrane glutamic endopeptidase [Pseudogracilibacillus sp. SO30301A]|uniref:CPBP family intramembrane glutamic endopeptidase n=1 Tax=Pseudogracilibacillus sp. SO30301A TaxID=3098291 RepID=UPI00300DE81A